MAYSNVYSNETKLNKITVFVKKIYTIYNISLFPLLNLHLFLDIG